MRACLGVCVCDCVGVFFGGGGVITLRELVVPLHGLWFMFFIPLHASTVMSARVRCRNALFFKKKVFIVFMRERVTACAVRERYEAAAAAAGCRSPVHRTAVKQRPLMARVRSAHARATPDVSVGQDTCSDGL